MAEEIRLPDPNATMSFSDGDDGLENWQIIMICFGSAVVLASIFTLIICACAKSNRMGHDDSSSL
jgi:hypothetical protein